MIIAVTYNNGNVFEHYGQTKQFKLYEVENNKIISTRILESGEYSHHTLAILLKNNNVEVLCCGGIGTHGVVSLEENGIKVFNDNHGDTDKVVEDYLNNKLTFSGGHTHECHH